MSLTIAAAILSIIYNGYGLSQDITNAQTYNNPENAYYSAECGYGDDACVPQMESK